jgi:hypothetical protein
MNQTDATTPFTPFNYMNDPSRVTLSDGSSESIGERRGPLVSSD